MSDTSSANARLAAAVVAEALRGGVCEWVVGAGARNLPLLQALLSLPEENRGRVWNFYDERAAAFFALGRAKALGGQGRIAVVVTSGTAAAELLPATVEAHYSGVPLLLITADRPAVFRGSGAPQAIEQLELLSPYVGRTVDWQGEPDHLLTGDGAGARRPEHWNVCLDEPAIGESAIVTDPAELGDAAVPAGAAESGVEVSIVESDAEALCSFCEQAHDGLLVLLGEIAAEDRPLVALALARLGAPVWADAASGLRESEELLPVLLRGGEGAAHRLRPERVLRIGGVPSLRYWRDLESMPDVDVLSLAPAAFSGLARPSRVIDDLSVLRAVPEQVRSRAQSQAAEESSRSARQLDELFEAFPASEPAVFRRLSRMIGSDARIFLGNSLPIREWNLAATFEHAHADCFVSRGANGIDGQLSTFLGTAAGRRGGDGNWGIFGDLTALYDLGAPWVLSQFADSVRCRFVVINNGGGRIFDRLPAMRNADARQVEVVRNSHQHEFRDWAAMWKLGYSLWHGGDSWRQPDESRAVIEIRPDDAQTEAFWQRWQTGGGQ